MYHIDFYRNKNVVETQHRMEKIIYVLRSKNLGQMKSIAAFLDVG